MAAVTAEEVFNFRFKGNQYRVPQKFILREHPGGKALVLPFVNGDITEVFEEAAHSEDALEMLEEWAAEVPVDRQAGLKERARMRAAEQDEWRWRSTAIAFGIGTVVAAIVLRRGT